MTGRDEAAFAALVQRHGPMVLGGCRRLLRNAHEAEDCFQATFLVLVHKARTIGGPESLGPWLYGVAYRTAARARQAARRRADRTMTAHRTFPCCSQMKTDRTPGHRATDRPVSA